MSVSALLGHQRLETTAIYTTPSQRDLERVVEKLEQDGRSPLNCGYDPMIGGAAVSDNIIPFPHTNGTNGSAQVRVVPYPVRARAVVEHDDHLLDAWDQIVHLVPQVEDLIDVHPLVGDPP